MYVICVFIFTIVLSANYSLMLFWFSLMDPLSMLLIFHKAISDTYHGLTQESNFIKRITCVVIGGWNICE